MPLLLLAAGAVVARSGQIAGGSFFIPGDAKAGMQVFTEKGCSRCHAVLGEGGRSAPDLARAPAGHLSAAEMVGAMWNHAPAMWEKMRLEGVDPPRFTDAEMANLFAFLYSVRSLDEPGDPDRGRALLGEKRCLECHAIAGRGGREGPDLKNWASHRNPVSWVQAMWNHAPAMQAKMSARGVAWPQFRGGDIADLVAFVRTATPAPKSRIYLRPANVDAGRRLFQSKGCAACHAVRGSGGNRAPDLGRRQLPRTLGQFAASMWNHAPAMRASMQARQVARPQFSNEEMADLIAYLFAERYFEGSGNAERGGRIFGAKGCAACHAAGASREAPALPGRLRASPIAMAAALWNHGPLMFQKMRERQVRWPVFLPGEMVDLMEFLDRGPRNASGHAGLAGGPAGAEAREQGKVSAAGAGR